jgi:hypothetical protein
MKQLLREISMSQPASVTDLRINAKFVVLGVSSYSRFTYADPKLKEVTERALNNSRDRVTQTLIDIVKIPSDNVKVVTSCNREELLEIFGSHFLGATTIGFYFLGHALPQGNTLYLGLDNFTSSDPTIGSISTEDLAKSMLRHSANTKFAFLDCCFAGTGWKTKGFVPNRIRKGWAVCNCGCASK